MTPDAVPNHPFHPSGAPRLDRMLGGGFPIGSAILVSGPAFSGRATMAKKAAVANMVAEIPVVYITTNTTASELHDWFNDQDPDFGDHLKKDLLWVIDLYSVSIGADEKLRNVTYVDAATDLNGLATALQAAQAKVAKKHEHQLVVLDSISTIVMHAGADTAFRYLQVMLGKSRRAGALCLALLDEGMHSEKEVEMFRHLTDGLLQTGHDKEQPQLRVQGQGLGSVRGWVQYKFDDHAFEVTGSLAAGRIH